MKRLPLFLGIILLVLGVIGLAHPTFTYHQREEVAKLGPYKATLDEEKLLQIPPAVSITLLAIGVVLIASGSRSRK
jgi:regulator of protease activity HflC (stomatin/prohibitin superfamily)